MCTVSTGGVLRCAGENSVGQLGLPPSDRVTPWSVVSAVSDPVRAALGMHVSCFWGETGRCAAPGTGSATSSLAA